MHTDFKTDKASQRSKKCDMCDVSIINIYLCNFFRIFSLEYSSFTLVFDTARNSVYIYIVE